MQSKRPTILFVTAFTVVFGFLTIATPLFATSKDELWYSFNGTDGSDPSGSLILDASGNLYGTTVSGGVYGCGTVFQLTPLPDDTWTENVLYSFNDNGTDGCTPIAFGGLVFDAAGNLYGMTASGGTGTGCVKRPCGTVFQLTLGPDSTWTENVLHSFTNNGTDGYGPASGLIFQSGWLYGTTEEGGTYDLGTVFQLVPGTKNGTWTETVLHSFNNTGEDGNSPTGSLISAGGKLYGTTQGGGAYSCGTVFELTPGTNGTWTEIILHSFNGDEEGAYPWAALTFRGRRLYGTTSDSGPYGGGTVFQLTRNDIKTKKRRIAWTETTIYGFNGSTDGYDPSGSLIFDAAGNLYGTTSLGGAYGGGTVFQLTPGAGATWTETLLYNLNNHSYPLGSLIFDAAGYLYGTTAGGGTYTDGIVFGFMP